MSKKPRTNRNSGLAIDDSLRQLITSRLSSFDRKLNFDPHLRQAAVALTILDSEKDGSASFLLTQRPRHLKRHGGQYALPGGRTDDNENIVQTSIRELREEVGIDLAESDVLGLLDDYQTRSGFNITPVVLWAGASVEIIPDPNEVAKVFRIPLDELKSPKIPVLEHSDESEHPVLSTPLATLGHRVFAPTAAFIYQFREIVLFGRHTRVGHFDQPKFAWK